MQVAPAEAGEGLPAPRSSPLQLTRLRVSGFKSFCDPAELAIEAGLTGIVGPNGCGKSNIVEALRWAMGESSAKGLRGEEMDDVIFGGSAARPAFDVAEVRLKLMGSTMPHLGIGDSGEIEVARRLGRGQGSVYRINGREVRARDVQLLFADAGAGSRSAAVIGQGQIGFIVESKPQDRRRLLEEAAGIGGLHARRRDAEARLAATEANLLRVQDLLREQEARLAELERQDRQAERYRKLAAELRQTEAQYLLARVREAEGACAAAATADETAREAVGATAAGLASMRRAREQLSGDLAAAKDEAAGLAAALAGLTERRAQLAAAASRLRTHRATLERQQGELVADRAAAARTVAELESELGRLGAEAETTIRASRELAPRLAAVLETEAEAVAASAAADRAQREAVGAAARTEMAAGHARAGLERARERLATIDALLGGLEATAVRATSPADLSEVMALQEAAGAAVVAAEGELAGREGEVEAAREALAGAVERASAARQAAAAAEADVREAQASSARLNEAQAASARAEARLRERARALGQRQAGHDAAVAAIDLLALEEALATSEQALEAADADLDAARQAAGEAEAVRGQAASEVREAQRGLDTLLAELRMLERLAAEIPPGAILPRLRIPERHARALAAALADDLLASEDPAAPLHWRELGPPSELPSLPEGATPLGDCVAAPEVLARSLSQVGVVPAESGQALQAQLQPGQRLVSPEGALWRWDGLVRGAEAEDTSAVRLRHRLRLEAAREEIGTLEATLATAQEREGGLVEALAQARERLKSVEARWRQADTAQTAAAQRLTLGRERVAALQAEVPRLAADTESLQRELAELAAERQGLPDPGLAQEHLAAARARLDEARADASLAEHARVDAAQRAQAAEKALAGARTALPRARAELEAAREAGLRRRAEIEAASRAEAAAAAERQARIAGLTSEREALLASLDLLAVEDATASASAERAYAAVTAAEAASARALAARDAARAEVAALRDDERRLAGRLTELAGVRASTEARLAEMRDRALEAGTRLQRLEGELQALGTAPAEDGAGLAGEIADLETDRDACHGRVRDLETRLAAAEAALAQAENAAGTAREQAALAQAERARAQAALEAAEALVLERLQRPAGLLLDDAETAAAVSSANLPTLEEKQARLRTARDRIGPVNLRAGVEAQEVRDALARSRAEEEELTAAIARLKQATARLNREGRERLQQVFTTVDGHFRELFVRLFGGGRAQLRLIGDDDPLAAGLELEASPPGKKLASISLLSGGEKTLTALALVFAFFLAHPAPLCVLDEVDAPLDDANVDRFVSLMQAIAAETGTRFLTVTHHPLTMARMDRLYGVTMSERGISRLVSVALEDAVAMRATA